MEKIIFITQRDPFFVDSFFREFLKYGYDIAIFDLPNFNRGKVWALKRALRLYGIVGVIKLIYLRAIYALKDSLSKEKIVSKKLDRLPHISELDEVLDSDSILVSVSAPAKIPVDWLNYFKYSLNIHCGLLPQYSGMMPIFWQAYDSADDVTITLHHMAEEIDTGNIIDTRTLKFSDSLYKTSVYAKQNSAELLHSVLQQGIQAKRENTAALEKLPLRGFPTAADVRELKKRFRLI